MQLRRALQEEQCLANPSVSRGIWEFPKIRDTFMGVSIIRTIILGSILGSPNFGNYHIGGYVGII